MNKVYCLFPYDKTTKFLKPIANAMKSLFGDRLVVLNIYTSDDDHRQVLETIANVNNGELIFFLGHGGTTYLNGAAGDMADMMVSDDYAYENPDAVYKHDELINHSNVSLFSKKKIFCLSCYSGEELGKMAVANGAITFLGFGDVPTSLEEFERVNLNVSEEEVLKFQNELTAIIISSIKLAVEKNYTFYQLSNLIKLFTNIRSRDLLIRENKSKSSRLVTDGLFHFKKGICLHGQKKLKLFET